MKRVTCAALVCAVSALRPMFAAPPAFVDITWMSISNMYYELGPLNIVTDGYITRLSQNAFLAVAADSPRPSGLSSQTWQP